MILDRRPFCASCFALVLILMSLTGCNLPFGGPNLPDPINPGGPASEAELTPTLAPTPTATPPPPPPIAIEDGDRHRLNGDWNSAMLAYQSVVTNPAATPDEIVAAQIGVAKTSIDRGDFATARASLDSLLAVNPDHPQAASAYFLRGEADMGIGDFGAALNDYQVYLSLRPGLIDTYVHERIGDAYLGFGQTEPALAAFDQALAAGRSTQSEVLLRERIAIIHRTLGTYDGAIAQYQAILDIAQVESYRATIDFKLAQTLFEAGRQEEAYEHFNYVFMTYPSSFEALSALRALIEAEIPVDQYQRGVVNYNQDQYDLAAEAMLNYLAATPLSEVTPRAHLIIALSYRALDNPQSAINELTAAINRFEPDDGDAWAEAWLIRADTMAQVGDTENALATLDQFVEDHGELPQAPDALYQAAALLEGLGDVTRSADYYRRLASQYPLDARAPEGLFRLGLDLYLAGDAAGAETLFTESAERSSSERPAAAYFWLARAQIDQGIAEPSAITAARVADGTAAYYAIRADDLLTGQVPFEAPASFALPADRDEGRAEAEQWLVDRFSLTETLPLAESLRADIAADPRFLTGRELWNLGLLIESRQSFEALRLAYGDDPLASYQLAIYFRDIGLYRSSLQAARAIHRQLGIHPLDGPVFLARLTYPIYFEDLVLPAAEQYGLNPLFIYSLIFQESQFESFAVSTAAAQGLMQIWPPTGQNIAARIDWPGYNVSDLQRPLVSVTFGTWLLDDEAKRFASNPYAMLAAYNAGPGNAGRWLEASGGDPDIYVEIVDLREPQLYIERITEHYEVYRALYGGQ